MTLDQAVVSSIQHQKHKQPKEKNRYWTSLKIKNFCAIKDTIKKVKTQPTEWEKIHANHFSDKGLESKNM